jgi:hypothetical protein
MLDQRDPLGGPRSIPGWVATSETNLALIPAGQVFWMSCLKSSAVTPAVASVQVHVKVGKSTAHTGTLPTVARLALTPDQAGVSQTLTGTLTNNYRKPLPQDATIYATYYDANGKFVGGASTQAGASVEAGKTVSFSFQNLGLNVTAAHVSVDPCSARDVLLHDCHLP